MQHPPTRRANAVTSKVSVVADDTGWLFIVEGECEYLGKTSGRSFRSPGGGFVAGAPKC